VVVGAGATVVVNGWLVLVVAGVGATVVIVWSGADRGVGGDGVGLQGAGVGG
jgi:hypothetical protein